MSTEVDNLSKITVDYVEEEVIKLVEPIAEYTRYLSSIKHAMTQRQEKKNAYINCIMDLESKQNSYQKLLATPGKEAQAQAKEAQVSSSQFATDNAKLDFEKVSERLLLEFEVFKSQKSNDLRDIIADFINIQVSTTGSVVAQSIYCN